MHCACVLTKVLNCHDQLHLRRKVHVCTGSKQVGQTSACGNTFVERLSLHLILLIKCTDVPAVILKQLYRLLHYTVQSAAWSCKWPVYKWPTRVHYMS